jgi:septal ring factor EnvC (AmiA/AmiB activator)
VQPVERQQSLSSLKEDLQRKEDQIAQKDRELSELKHAVLNKKKPLQSLDTSVVSSANGDIRLQANRWL